MTFIDPRSKTLRHLDRIVDWNRGGTPAPVTVEWDLSNRCSLGCQDCHFAHTHSRGPWVSKSRTLPMAFDSTGDLADHELVIRVLGELVSAGVQSVVWSGGGEPTLYPGWYDAVAVAYAYGLRQGMYTLGAHLTKDTAWGLAARTDFVVVSLDACDRETYGADKGVRVEQFDKAVQGIRWLVGHRAAVGVSFLLHEDNYTRAHDMLTLSRSLGATYTTFRPAIRVDQAQPSKPIGNRDWVSKLIHFTDPDVEMDMDRFIAYRDWQSHGYSECKGVRLNTTITPDGRVWLCPQRRGVAGSCLGDLRIESFSSIWARHPGHYTVDDGCRVMCRLHPVNQTIAVLETPQRHEAFV